MHSFQLDLAAYTPPRMVTKLADLVIGEVSGVDDPANLLRGWLVRKGVQTQKTRGIGPDEVWDVNAAERRVREATGATSEPTQKYASCFLWTDGEAVSKNFGDYKFLVCDVVGGEIKLMPQAIRAAADLVHKSSIPDGDKAEVLSLVSSLGGGIGIDATRASAADAEEAMSIVGKIKSLVFSAGPEQEVEMTTEELTKTLDERFAAQSDAIGKSLAEALAAAPAGTDGSTASEGAQDPPTTPTPALSAEDVSKAVDEVLQPVLEIIEKVLERVERCESTLAITSRKSIDGQEGQPEGDPTPPATPTVKDAIAKVLQNPQLPQRAAS